MSDEATLPHDDYAERGVVGGVMHDNAQLAPVVEIVRVSDFYTKRNKILFQAEIELAASGKPVDLLTLRDWLEDHRKMQDVGGMAYVASVHGDTPHFANVKHHASMVKKKAAEREILTDFTHLSKALMNGHSPEDRRRAIADYRELLETNVAIIDGSGTKDVTFELASAVLGRPTPETPWRAAPILADGDLGIISGSGGIGKSFLAQSLAISLASGVPVFEQFQVAAPVRVGFLDLESRAWELDARINRLASSHGLKSVDLKNLLLIRERIRFDRAEDVRRLWALIERERLAFMMVDSFRRMVAGDVNKSEVTNALFSEALDPIRVETGCGFVMVDHDRKLTGEAELDSPDQAMTGSADKRNMIDLHIGVQRRDGNLCITTTKTRHGALPEPFLVALDGLSGDDDEPVTVRYVGAVDRASDATQDALLTLVREAGTAGVLRGELIGRSHYSDRGVTNALRALKKRGLVTSKPEGKQARYLATEAPRAHDGKTRASGETES